MIMLTRLSGSRFALNSDLIERVDATPDTVISLTDGAKYVVAETLDEVVAAVRYFRSEIVALSGLLTPPTVPPMPPTAQHGRLVPLREVTTDNDEVR